MKKRYLDFNTYLKSRFGERVHKLTVDAGLNCPNRDGTISTGGCIYCNAKGSGTGQHQQGKSIREQLESAIPKVRRRFKADKYVAYFQSYTNTYAPVHQLRQLYEDALGVAGVVGLAVGTRPDCVSAEVIDLLAEYAVDRMVWLEYGLQSSNDATLACINRGHDAACFADAVKMTRGRRILTCAHVILGLPGETREEMRNTARFVADLGMDGIKIHLLYVIRNTPLETWYHDGTYRCLEREEYADLVCEVLELLPPDMVIQRLTGDPHPAELVAPQWALDKKGTMECIVAAMEKRDAWQGKKYE